MVKVCFYCRIDVIELRHNTELSTYYCVNCKLSVPTVTIPQEEVRICAYPFHTASPMEVNV